MEEVSRMDSDNPALHPLACTSVMVSMKRGLQFIGYTEKERGHRNNMMDRIIPVLHSKLCLDLSPDLKQR